MNGVGVEMDEVLVPIPIGTWEVHREGTGVAVLAVGPMVQIASEAAVQLSKEGIHIRVINARFIKPLDESMLLELAKERMHIITMEEGVLQGGFGSSVLEFYSEHNIFGMHIKTIGIPDCFVEHGSVQEQRAEAGLTVERLISEVRSMQPRQRQRA